MDDALPIAIGATAGAISIIPFWKAPVKVIFAGGFLALAMMLMIYVGAHLASSDFHRIILEAIVASGVLLLAVLIRNIWPLGIGFMVLAHGAYDFFQGHQAGVALWYPPLCVGFDVVVGSAIILLMWRNRQQESTP